eukprot:TRINITY_DN638_c0_g1_i1.p1 TRINITY_DN638_c0_g1~~TRINITY_DN638_c0_g1_i1.p1  ORF type:complete len:208 (+),score=46.15 TRINITY_DN638_c0_g1_i1:126-749(+)
MERLLGPASAVKDTGGDAQAGERRSSSRVKKMAVKVADAIADEAARQRMVSARLNALESDYTAGGRSQGRKGGVDGDDDVEFMGDGDDEAHVGQKRSQNSRGNPGRRKTRFSRALEQQQQQQHQQQSKKAPKSFAELLEEAKLDEMPPYVPSYCTAAIGPPRATISRPLCSVCGSLAPYTCTRCGTRFCSCRCLAVHTDTRCLKFVS